jgi:hypothetical protein
MNLSATGETFPGRILPFVVLIGTLFGTFLVYSSTREFSFFLDDAFDLARLEMQTTWQILFQPVADYGYHRPITFLLFKTNYDLFGEHNTTALRTIMLLLHALSASSLYLLVRRLTGSEWAIAASALFLLFPFSYQTLNIIGAMAHILVVFFTLLALLFWIEGRYRGLLTLKILAAFSAILAAWTMEYGVIALPMIVGLELYLRRRVDMPELPVNRSLGFLGVLVLGQVIYLVIWFGLERGATASSGLDDIARNGTLWLQSVAYPGTRFLNLLFAGDEPMAYRTVILASVIILAVGLAIHAYVGQIRIALVALGVAFICFLPAMLMLTHEYVLDSPRLLYVTAPAIATFWALLGRGLFTDRRITFAWQGAVAVFILITLVHSHSLIERRVEMFRTSESVVNAVVEIGEEHSDSPVLLMNTPSWFSFHSMVDQEYPLWHLGVQGIPPYVGLDGLYYATTGENVVIESAALSPDVSGWDYAFGPHGQFVDHDHINERLRSGYILGVMSISDGVASVHQPGDLTADGQVNGSSAAVFAERVALDDLDWHVGDATLDVHMEWHVIEPLESDYQIAIETLDSGDNLILEHRDYALDGMSPPRLWQPGDTIRDHRRIAIDPGENIDQVFVSLINTGDETRLEITGSVIGTRESNRAGY